MSSFPISQRTPFSQRQTAPGILAGLVCCLVLLCLNPPAVLADAPKPLRIGVSFSIPPWVFANEDQGIELDILKESLKGSDYSIEPVYLPFNRAFYMYDQGQLDGIINARIGSVESGYYSEPAVTFQNIAISRAEKDFPESFPMEFFSGRHVVAFQRASQFLSDAFGDAVRDNPDYQEAANQELQLNLLFYRDVDFIIMEKQIFRHFIARMQTETSDGEILYGPPSDVRLHPVFPMTHYRFVFRDPDVRDAFDEGLRALKASGRYDRIIESYLGPDN